MGSAHKGGKNSTVKSSVVWLGHGGLGSIIMKNNVFTEK